MSVYVCVYAILCFYTRLSVFTDSVCVRKYTHECVCMCGCRYMCTLFCAFVIVFMRAIEYVRLCAFAHLCVSVCECLCVCVCVCVCVFICSLSIDYASVFVVCLVIIIL